MCKTSTNKQPAVSVFRSLAVRPPQPARSSSSSISSIQYTSSSNSQAQQQQQQQQQQPALTLGARDNLSTGTHVLDANGKRIILPACVNCRRSKVKCTGGIPCNRCTRLSLQATCKRCVPKKRGRKRKSATNTATLPPVVSMAALTSSSSSSSSSSSAKRSRNGMSAKSRRRLKQEENQFRVHQQQQQQLHPQQPQQSDADEKRAINEFAFLTGQFRYWREQMPMLSAKDDTALPRFLWFCSHLSHVISKYAARFQGQTDAQCMVSVWLCSNLAHEVNEYVSSIGDQSVSFPNVSNGGDTLQLGVQKEVYRHLPLGVIVQSLYPRPFAANGDAWVNDTLARILGFETRELLAMVGDRQQFNRLVDEQSFADVYARYWAAVARGATHYTQQWRFMHKAGHVVELLGTLWIRYRQGIPMCSVMFLQTDPLAQSASSILDNVPAMEEIDPLADFESLLDDSVEPTTLTLPPVSPPPSSSQQESTDAFGLPMLPLDGMSSPSAESSSAMSDLEEWTSAASPSSLSSSDFGSPQLPAFKDVAFDGSMTGLKAQDVVLNNSYTHGQSNGSGSILDLILNDAF